MKERRSLSALTTLAALGLLGAFAVGLLLSVLGGTGIYARLSRREAETARRRTAIRLLATRAQSAEALSVAQFGDGDALLVTETVGGEVFLTRLYCHDGWLMELYTAAEGTFLPEDGERLVPAEALSLRLEDRLLHLEIISGGKAARLQLSLRKGDAP